MASRAGAIRRPYEDNVRSDEASRALKTLGWEDDGDGSGDDRRGARRGGGRGESHRRGDATGRTSRGIKQDAATTRVDVKFASTR